MPLSLSMLGSLAALPLLANGQLFFSIPGFSSDETDIGRSSKAYQNEVYYLCDCTDKSDAFSSESSQLLRFS